MGQATAKAAKKRRDKFCVVSHALSRHRTSFPANASVRLQKLDRTVSFQMDVLIHRGRNGKILGSESAWFKRYFTFNFAKFSA